MVGMIFEPIYKSARHSLSFRNKLTLLPLKTYSIPVTKRSKKIHSIVLEHIHFLI